MSVEGPVTKITTWNPNHVLHRTRTGPFVNRRSSKSITEETLTVCLLRIHKHVATFVTKRKLTYCLVVLLVAGFHIPVTVRPLTRSIPPLPLDWAILRDQNPLGPSIRILFDLGSVQDSVWGPIWIRFGARSNPDRAPNRMQIGPLTESCSDPKSNRIQIGPNGFLLRRFSPIHACLEEL